MSTDLFNNPSNDYVYPTISPCPGAEGEQYLEFVKDGLGVVSGSEILSYVDFGSIKIPVSAYSVETKIIGEREVIYIPGLTKGLTLRQEGFTMPNTIGDDSNNYLFMQVDLSINYYSGFKFTNSNIDVSSNYSQNINIEDALNLALGNLNIKASATYDPSILTFKGTLDGYDFNISNVVLTLIDASENSNSPFPYPWVFSLEEDKSAKIPAAKYPNGGMQGIIMKGIFPGSTSESPYDHWLYINHISDQIKLYENVVLELDPEIMIYFDPSTSLGTKSILGSADASGTIDSSTMLGLIIEDGSIGNSIMTDCSIQNSIIFDSSLITSYLIDSIVNVTLGGVRPIFSEVTIWDSSLDYVAITDSSIYGSYIIDSSVNNCTLYNVKLENCTETNNRIVNIDSSIYNILTDSSVYYELTLKTLDVGMDGCSTSKIMSGGDYLEWITDNNYWNKFGDMYIWTTAADCPTCGYSKNLLDGFYVYNPQPFDIKIEYMLFI